MTMSELGCRKPLVSTRSDISPILYTNGLRNSLVIM